MNYLNILKVIRGLNKDPKIKSILDSINKDQLDNKKWLIEESEKYFYFHYKPNYRPKVLVVAGWYGLLANLISDRINERVHSSDIDPACKEIGEKMFGENVKYTTKDINDYGRKHLEEYDFIICTSCEHISDDLINKLISKKREDAFVILQSNNYFELDEHINCKKSLLDFKNSIKLKIDYEGVKSFLKYDRYMLIGR